MTILSASSHTGSRNRAGIHWLAWMPVLMVSAMLFWTVALGLGALSLMAVTELSRASQQDGDAGDLSLPSAPRAEDADSIVVHLQESVEPEDVNDNAGSGASSVTDPAAESPEASIAVPVEVHVNDPSAFPTSDSGPGNTAY